MENGNVSPIHRFVALILWKWLRHLDELHIQRVKLPVVFFTDRGNRKRYSMRKCERTQITMTVLGKDKRDGSSGILEINLHFRAMGTKAAG